MGIYGDILDKLDDSLFVKIEPGKPASLRLLDHPWISQKSFTDKQTGEVRIVTQFHWPVWDYGQQRVRILTQGKSVFKQIANAAETWRDGDTMPSPFDVVIKRSGTGQFDTEYTVSPIPYSGTMPSIPRTDLPDMEEKSRGIPIQQLLQGKQVPVLPPAAPRGAVPLPEPARPTHQDLAAVDQRTPGGGDVIPNNIPEGDVDLSGIDPEVEEDYTGPIPDNDPSLPERPEFLQ